MAHYYPLFDYFDLEKMSKRCRKLERLFIAENVDNVQYVLFGICFGEKKTSLMCSGNFFLDDQGSTCPFRLGILILARWVKDVGH
jgi:hypothetical protein